MNRRLVLFDIDGTLLFSRGAGRRAIVAALADLFPEAGAATQLRFDGKTDPQIVIELLEAAGVADPGEPRRVAAILDRYLTVLERELAIPGHQTEVLPGVEALLDRVEQAEAAVLGLLTGNIEAGARLKLSSAALAPDRFRVGAFGSDHADRTRLPAIAAERAVPWLGRAPRGPEMVVIGDTPADVICGAAFGARAIGVATGFYSTEQLARAGAWAVFDDLTSADQIWEAIWS